MMCSAQLAALNPNCFSYSISYFVKNSYNLLHAICSNNFEKHGKTERSLQFVGKDLSTFLKIAVTQAVLSLFGKALFCN